ncbi:DUF4118 domain-containing protein [Anaerotignum sp. MB30-C6]|uniref:DUF4118 domain-containing protein n=1 Tax=Anaerotignum sp. MB30-C6 TaxID=3070814 RepID=UPI0027DAEDC1|nr:DUF4118 domain-containing protein [Anaerotignum sp. MB30-C6]WMI80292.1 DUF4118 domain-containing protein [Anaerotignum sp. MB30-C6]
MAKGRRMKWQDILWTILVLMVTTALGGIFHLVGFEASNIIMVYILGVLLTAVLTSNRVYTVISSMLSVLTFNFFFTEPVFTFSAYDTGDTITFLIMFLVAIFAGTLAVKIKMQAEQSAAMAYRTKILLETNQLLQQARGVDGILHETAKQLVKLLERTVVCYRGEGAGQLSEGDLFLKNHEEDGAKYLALKEKEAAQWVFENNQQAGSGAEHFSESLCRYLAVRSKGQVFCVYGISLQGKPLEAFDTNLLLSILGECALALEKELMSRKREEAAAQAKNEQLRANLLRGISHDLRTPLTCISGNAAVLLNNGDAIDEARRKALYLDIYDDSMWLINLIENLLSVTRIENGTMQLYLQAELMDEVITEALRHIDRKKSEHVIVIEETEEMLLAKMDARLIIQVMINLVNNAIKYTESGSEIKISMKRLGDRIEVSVADNGKGIPDRLKESLFEMFYTASHTISDTRRGLGMGLPLCKSIILSHGGTIHVTDNVPHGSIFTFTLQAEEVPLHE